MDATWTGCSRGSRWPGWRCGKWGALTTAGAALAAVACDAVALWPTLREAWRQPQLESLPSWGADVAGNGCCLFAVSAPSTAALAFPTYLVLASAAVAGILLARRPRLLAPAAPAQRTHPAGSSPVTCSAVRRRRTVRRSAANASRAGRAKSL